MIRSQEVGEKPLSEGSCLPAADPTSSPVRLFVFGTDPDGRAAFLSHLTGAVTPRLPAPAESTLSVVEPPWADFMAILQRFGDPITAISSSIPADTCPHENSEAAHTHFPLNMAIVLIDAGTGAPEQARKHCDVASRLAAEQVIVAIQGMHLVHYSGAVFDQIVHDFATLAPRGPCFVPVSQLTGGNIAFRDRNMPWYGGPTIAEHLAGAAADPRLSQLPLRMFILGVNDAETRTPAYDGVIASGALSKGARVRIQPGGGEATVKRISCENRELDVATEGQAVRLQLSVPLQANAGDLLCDAQSSASVADQFRTTLFWTHPASMLPGRTYLMKLGTRTAKASVTEIRHLINIDTLETLAAKRIDRGAIAECNLALDKPITFDAYEENRNTGCYMLFDADTMEAAGLGLLHFALRRSQNIHLQHIDVTKQVRSAIKRQVPCVLWFTGLSGAGKSTIANLIERKLHSMGYHTYLLDGDNVRHGLNRDLGFTAADRVENIRRIAEVAKLMVDAGLIVITAFISPFRAEREMARSLLEEREFVEVFVDTPLAVAERRDVKGLYKKARNGELRNFTGIDSPYEVPENPEFRLDTTVLNPSDAADQVIAYFQANGYIL